MKLTDLALVFVVILLPIVIIVYVNTSFVIRAEREEMYYKNMITSAVTDATNAMKVVENEDSEIDYGYSGIVDNKVSVSAEIAVDTFFTSLYNNLGIKGNAGSEQSIKSYIPALAIIDYDGIYIYSAEEINGEIEYVLKPKKYFTYMYYIDKNTHEMKEYTSNVDRDALNAGLVYQVTFTQDDYVFLNIYQVTADGSIKKYPKDIIDAFYLGDTYNNTWLIGEYQELYNLGSRITSSEIYSIKQEGDNSIVSQLQEKRKEIIAKICMEELSYAVNAHNYFARKAGVKYQFNFSINSDDDWYDTVDGIGMVAVVQGISLGNRYLNYSAYSVSDLTSAKRYYLSDVMQKLQETTEMYEQLSKYKYYHASDTCPIYEAYKVYISKLEKDHIAPSFMYDKEEIAANGFHACFICKP